MANGKYAKRDQRAADLARQFGETKEAGRHKQVIRCRSCKPAGRPVHIEMGGFVFCDVCVEAAAEIVADKKAGR